MPRNPSSTIAFPSPTLTKPDDGAMEKRRCIFSMTNPARRIIGAKLADAECRVESVQLIGSGRINSGKSFRTANCRPLALWTGPSSAAAGGG